jgi:hypothetical protein
MTTPVSRKPAQPAVFAPIDHAYWVWVAFKQDDLLDFLTDKAQGSIHQRVGCAIAEWYDEGNTFTKRPSMSRGVLMAHPLLAMFASAMQAPLAGALEKIYLQLEKGEWPHVRA